MTWKSKTYRINWRFTAWAIACLIGIAAVKICPVNNTASSVPTGPSMRPDFASLNNSSNTSSHASEFETFLDAIEFVESGCDPKAVGKLDEVGSFQLRRIYVDDVNRIKRLKHTSKYRHVHQWSYSSRSDRVSSRWMVRTYLQHYGKGKTFEEMARIHNGGPAGHKKECTKKYWEKVRSAM